MNRPLSRRRLIQSSAAALAALPFVDLCADEVKPPAGGCRQAMGAKVGEITDCTAVVWTRLTANEKRAEGFVFPAKRGDKVKIEHPPLDQCDGACPGAVGRVRVRYGTKPDLSDAAATEWIDVAAATDFSHQFALKDLRPDTPYHYAVETTSAGGAAAHAPFTGRFETAPTVTTPSDLRFCMMTCQGYPDRGHPDGHPIYPSMLALKPKFVVYAGDNVYYDNDPPSADSVELARYHWQRMFSLPRIVAMLQNAGAYFTKDDHDTLTNDSWPGAKVGGLTYARGQEIYREQVPSSDKSYRTFRWGKDLQIWLTDGRDYRSANKMPDGPQKTIWGEEQKAWFKQTVKESDATWKLLLSPTPIVGPDRKGKNDNHANSGFQTEGDELRSWMQQNVPDNFFVCCGDRHWQYYSVHPETKVREFSVGPASNEHAGGTPGLDPAYHKFHRVKGGFLSVTLKRTGKTSAILFEHRDVDGIVVHEERFEREA